MVIKTQAHYFDGQTSAPHNVELTLNTAAMELSYTDHEDNAVCGSVSDIRHETFNHRMEIRFKNREIPVIVQDAEFINSVKSTSGLKSGVYQTLINQNFKTFLLITPVAVFLIIAAYLSLTSFVAEKAVLLIPTTVDVALGRQFMNRYDNLSKIDSAKTFLLTEFASRMSWGNMVELNFHVIRSDYTVNALALPSGDIIVFTGLLDKIDDYETLAALLGHEITHVNRRHSMQSLCKSLAGYALISVLTTDVSGLMAVIMENANLLANLSFSRNMEREADDGGMALLEQNGINSAGMLKLMRVLQSSGSDARYDIISTHPETKKRIRRIESKINEGWAYAPRPELERLFGELRLAPR